MKLRMTVTWDYSTGANDEETRNAYDTTDPEECAKIDRESVELLGLREFLDLADIEPVSFTIEPVRE